MKRTLIGGAILVVLTAAAAAQTTRTATMDDLVAEIRALRADLNQTSSVSVRTQLLVARLQLQEQRIASVGKQLLDVQSELTRLETGNAVMRSQIKEQDTVVSRMPPEQRQSMEKEFVQMRALWEGSLQREQTLRAQASEMAAALATEQSRWSEFNDRIDALERSLDRR
jgi:hypothetical protein